MLLNKLIEEKEMPTVEDYKRYMKITWQLTPTEEEIAALMIMGLSNKQISKMIGISSETVNKHLDNIFRKAKLRGRKAVFRRLLLEATL